jgi:hypothetical protein
MQPTPFRLLNDSTIKPDVKAGTTVYEYLGYDYGLASDDTRMTRIEHVSVTLEPNVTPSFTVPRRDLAPIS